MYFVFSLLSEVGGRGAPEPGPVQGPPRVLAQAALALDLATGAPQHLPIRSHSHSSPELKVKTHAAPLKYGLKSVIFLTTKGTPPPRAAGALVHPGA